MIFNPWKQIRLLEKCLKTATSDFNSQRKQVLILDEALRETNELLTKREDAFVKQNAQITALARENAELRPKRDRKGRFAKSTR